MGCNHCNDTKKLMDADTREMRDCPHCAHPPVAVTNEGPAPGPGGDTGT